MDAADILAKAMIENYDYPLQSTIDVPAHVETLLRSLGQQLPILEVGSPITAVIRSRRIDCRTGARH